MTITAQQQQTILTKMGYSSASQTGTDTHTITHVVNNSNNDYEKILNDLLSERQRSEEEINDRYNQTFLRLLRTQQLLNQRRFNNGIKLKKYNRSRLSKSLQHSCASDGISQCVCK